MNNPSRRAPLPRTTPLPTLAAAAALLALAGCAKSPFRTYPGDYGDDVPRQRLLEVEPVSLLRSVEPADETPVAPDPIAQEDRVELALAQARAFTLENNLDLRVSLINPTAAGQNLRAEEAAWDAIFSVDARWTETDQPTSTGLVGSQISSQQFTPRVSVPLRTGGNVSVGMPINQSSNNNPFTTLDPAIDADFEVSISQPLLRGGGRESATHALRVATYQEGIELSRTKLEVVRQLASVDRNYWGVYAALRALDVARQQFELATTQLDRSRRLYDNGRVAEIEVTRAEEGVAQRLEGVIQAGNAVKRQQRALKRVMNAPNYTLDELPIIWPVTDPDPVPLALDADDLTQTAMHRRMELLELELQLAIDASVTALRENEALPLFTLDYTYRVNGLGDSLASSVDQLTDKDFEDWSLGLRFETPVTNDAAEARVARAVIDRLQRLATREARRQSIEQEVRDAVDNIDDGWQRILAARQSALLAGRTLAAEQRQFDVGRNTTTDVLDAATRLADAQLAEIRALTDYQIAQVDLAFATGSVLGAALVDWEPYDPRADDNSATAQ